MKKQKNQTTIIIIILAIALLIFLFMNKQPSTLLTNDYSASGTGISGGGSNPSTPEEPIDLGIQPGDNAADSDGYDNPDVYGTCDDGKAYINKDVCVSGAILKEWYIDADDLKTCVSKDIECYYSYCSNGACVDVGNDDCQSSCESIQKSYNFGFCKQYNNQGALSKSQVCTSNGGTYEGGAGGCHRGYICCCDTLELA